MDRRLGIPVAAGVSLAFATALALSAAPTDRPPTPCCGHASHPVTAVRTNRTGPPSAPADPTTVVVIMTDDQRADLLPWMPAVRRHLVAHGTVFRNAFVVNPLCCPSRAAFLTGTYSHTNGVWANDGPYGGYGAFVANGNEARTFATWFDRAGWRTALIGKYLNGYGAAGQRVPEGWDRWLAFAMPNGGYHRYLVNDDGDLVWRGRSRNDYSSDAFTREAVRTIKGTAPERPLLLVVGYYAPHGPRTPAARHRDAPVDPRLLTPNVGEADRSDKPPYVRARHTSARSIQARHAAEVRSLLAVDDGVRRIVRALEDGGRLDGSMIVFTSDNGWLDGEHGLAGKFVPYEESIRVPLVIRADALSRIPAVEDRPALNIDLAATIADFAGVPAGSTDGESLVPLLTGGAARWRHRFLFEHVRTGAEKDPPTYCGFRGVRWKFVRYADGVEELYDIRADPWELENLVGRPGYGVETARAREVLRRMCSPRPPGMPPF